VTWGVDAHTRFFVTALIGYAMVIACIGVGALVGTERLDAVRREQESRTSGYLRDLQLAEQLRAASFDTTAAVRGYLIARDARFLDRLRASERSFADTVAALRTRKPSDPANTLARVQSAASAYRAARAEVVDVAVQDPASDRVAELFESRVSPQHRELDRALDAFVASESQAVEEIRAASRARAQTTLWWSRGMLGTSVLISAIMAAFAAYRLSMAHRHDIDARRHAERALAAKDEALGVLAHDLRTPLGAIALKAAMIRIQAGKAEVVRAQAASIETAARWIAGLADKLLDAATIEAGGLSLSLRECPIAAIVAKSFELCESQAAGRRIRLERRVHDDDDVVLADRDRVVQVLNNLVGNALRFTPEGGTITVETDRVGGQIHVIVSDTGPGIPESEWPSLFDRFFTRERGSGHHGLGLGLFIARRLVEAHGGTLCVAAAASGGAAFHFTLPAGTAGAG
jgi:signal transduction histidine kinase